MGKESKDIQDYPFSVYWDVYEGMWAAECVSIKLQDGFYLRDLGLTPQEAVTNFLYLLEIYLELELYNSSCREGPEKK